MALTRDEIDAEIRELFADTYSMQGTGEATAALAEETVLLDTGLDSLGFAILVTRLEEELGFDPFSLSEEAYYPSTYREFLDFYVANQPR